MKQVLGWFFLLVFLMGHTEMVQVLRLPFLCLHYLEHKTEKEPLTLATYLHVHYAHTSDADDDAAEDARLPFKNLPPSWLAQQDFVADVPRVLLMEDALMASPEFSFPSTSNVYSQYLASIWQPPQA